MRENVTPQRNVSRPAQNAREHFSTMEPVEKNSATRNRWRSITPLLCLIQKPTRKFSISQISSRCKNRNLLLEIACRLLLRTRATYI